MPTDTSPDETDIETQPDDSSAPRPAGTTEEKDETAFSSPTLRSPAAAPVKPWSFNDNPEARHQDAYREVDQQAFQRFNREHPFAPSSWQPPTPEKDYSVAAKESDAQAAEQLRSKNAELEARMRGTGQRYYRDDYGQIQPVIEAETGRPIYEPLARTQGVNPETNEPAWVARDRYGQMRYERPRIIANPLDHTDEQLYYDFGEGQQVPAGKMSDLLKSKDFGVQRAALKAVHDRRAEQWKEAIAPMQEEVNNSAAAFDEAQMQHESLGEQARQIQSQIDAINQNPQNNETQGGVLGFGAHPTDAAMQLRAQKDALQAQLKNALKQQSNLEGQLNEGGTLYNQRKNARFVYAIFKAKASHDNYSDLAEERRAILSAQGKPEADDPTLQSILQAQKKYGKAIDRFAGAIQPGVSGIQSSTPPPAQSETSAAFPEPYELAAQGANGVGGISVHNLAARYGSGQGEVRPDSLVKMSQRIGDINEMLADKNTALRPPQLDALKKEGDYLNGLYLQRMAKLPAEAQRRVIDATRDPTLAEKALGMFFGAVGGAATGVADVAEFAQRHTPFIPYSEETRQKYAKLRKTLGGASRYGSSVPEVQQKLADSIVTGTLPEFAGEVAPMLLGGEAVTLAGKAAGLGEKALGLMSKVAAASTGAAQGGNSLRNAAIDTLAPKLRDGTISKDEYTKAVGLAEAFGTATGAAQFLPISRIAQRLVGSVTSKTLVGTLLDRMAKGGSRAAEAWLRGAGRKAVSDVVSEGIEQYGVGFLASVANDLGAKHIFDPNRKIDWQKAAAQGAGQGLGAAFFSAMSHVLSTPKIQNQIKDQAKPTEPEETEGSPNENEPAFTPNTEQGLREAILNDQSQPRFTPLSETPHAPPAEADELRRKTEDWYAKHPNEADKSTAMTLDKIGKLNAQEFYDYAQNLQKNKTGITNEAKRMGLDAKGDQAALARLAENRQAALEEVKKANDEGREDDALALGAKAQFFREALEAATGSETISQPPVSSGDQTQPLSKPEGAGPAVRTELKPLPEGASAEYLGKQYIVAHGHGEEVDQWQVKLPGEEGRGRTMTTEMLAKEGYKAPEIAEQNGGQHAIQEPSPGEVSIRQPSETSARVGGENAVAQGAPAAREAKTPTGSAVIPEKVVPAKSLEERIGAAETKIMKTFGGDALFSIQNEASKRKWSDQTYAERLEAAVAKIKSTETEKPNVADTTAAALRDELKSGGVTKINGKSVRQADPAQLMNAVYKLRQAQEAGGQTESVKVSDRLTSIIERLEKARKMTPEEFTGASGLHSPTPDVIWHLAHDAAINFAILALRAGRTVNEAIQLAIGRLKERFPGATKEHEDAVRAAIQQAAQGTAAPENKPPAPTGNEAASGQGENKKLSKLPESLKDRSHPIESIPYNISRQEAAAAEAQRIINQDGEENARNQALDPNTTLKNDVRVGIVGELLSRQMAKLKEAKSPEDVAKITQEANRLVAGARPELATDVGQGIAMWNHVYKDQRVAAPMELTRSAQERQSNILGKEGVKALDDAGKAVTEARDKAIERATKSLDKSLRQTPVTKPVWERYRENAAKRMIDLVESGVTLPKDKAPLQEFTNRIIAEIRGRIKPLLPENPSAERLEPTSADILREALDNKDKYADVLTMVRNAFEKKYGEGSPALDLIDTELANLGLKPYSERLLDKAIKLAHEAMLSTAKQVAKQHWTKTDAKAGDLASALVKEAGVSGADAVRLAADLSERTKAIYAEERSKAIDALKKRYENTPMAKRVFSAVEKAGALNNIGALTRSDVQDAVAKELRLPQVTPVRLKQIADLADKVEIAENPAAKARATLDLAQEMRKAKSLGKWAEAIDTGTSVWYANLLWGSAMAIKAGGDTLNSVAQMATAIAANSDHANTLVSGWLDGMGLGWEKAKTTFKTGKGGVGYDPLTGGYGKGGGAPNKLSQLENAKNPYTHTLKFVPRTFKAIEAFFYHTAQEAYAKLAATKILEGKYEGRELKQKVQEALGLTPAQFEGFRKQAESEGFQNEDAGLRVGQLIEEERQKNEAGLVAHSLAKKFGEETVYKQEPTGLAGVIYRILADAVNNKVKIKGVPVLKPFLPFLKIPTNLFNESLNYTPIGAKRAWLGTKDVNGKGRIEFNGDERARLLIKSTAGSLLMGGLVARALLSDNKDKWFDITGAGPKDYNKLQQLKQTGWMPHSVKLGENYYNYMYSPLMVPLSVVGAVTDSIRYQKQRDEMVLANRVADAASAGGRAIFDTSMLDGLSNLMAYAKGDASSNKISRFLASTATSTVVPNVVRQIDMMIDPTQREAHTTGEILKSTIPFLRRELPVRTDVLGGPTTYSPTQRFVSAHKEDAVRDILLEKNLFVEPPSRGTKIGNRVMTDQEYDDYRKMSGQRIKIRLEAMLPMLKTMSGEEAQKAVEQISREERQKIHRLLSERANAGHTNSNRR